MYPDPVQISGRQITAQEDMIMGIITILWEKWREFVRDFSRITLAAMIAPLMYLIVFGWGIRTTMNGQPYLYFLIPGVISLTTMNGSFNAIAQNLNVQRLYEKAFDQVIISPLPLAVHRRPDHRRSLKRHLCRRHHPAAGITSQDRTSF